jgi:hypothetical protein
MRYIITTAKYHSSFRNSALSQSSQRSTAVTKEYPTRILSCAERELLYSYSCFLFCFGACWRQNCDGIGHPANVSTCARMALCPISFQIHTSIHLNSFIYCAKEHFLCFCFKYNAKTYAICTEYHIN